MAMFYLSESSIHNYKKIKSLNESLKVMSIADEEKILSEYQNDIYNQLIKNKNIKCVEKIDNFSLDITFKESHENRDELTKFVKENIYNILDLTKSKFEKKYKANFYWREKVVDIDSALIILDTTICYDYNEKILFEYRDNIRDQLIKNKDIKQVEIKERGFGQRSILDITFKESYKDQNKYNEFVEKNIYDILKSITNKFEKEYKAKFEWIIKDKTDNSIIIRVDTDLLHLT